MLFADRGIEIAQVVDAGLPPSGSSAQIMVLPDMKLTVPPTVPALELTVAVAVTKSPGAADAFDVVTVVVVGL